MKVPSKQILPNLVEALELELHFIPLLKALVLRDLLIWNSKIGQHVYIVNYLYENGILTSYIALKRFGSPKL